jgi:hypothetical protein
VFKEFPFKATKGVLPGKDQGLFYKEQPFFIGVDVVKRKSMIDRGCSKCPFRINQIMFEHRFYLPIFRAGTGFFINIEQVA